MSYLLLNEMMKLDKIKHGQRILDALSAPMFLADIASTTSIDSKTVQNAINKLHKEGFIVKDKTGRWVSA